jgi:hypothetical protein
MADNFIQVAPDGSGKQMQTYMNVIGANSVHAEAVVLVDSTGTPLGTTAGALNVSGNINATLPGTVNVQQSNASNLLATVSQGAAAWYLAGINSAVTAISANASNFLATVASITNPVTVAQSNASNLAATVSGTITANAGANLNTSALALSASQTNGGQKTQIVDPTNASNGASVINNALNVYIASITANAGTNLNTANISVKQFQGGASIGGGQVLIGNVATTIAGARATRRSVTIRNQDTLNTGYIGPANVNTSNGLLLLPRDSISVDYVGIIQGITAGNNVTFGYLETYD